MQRTKENFYRFYVKQLCQKTKKCIKFEISGKFWGLENIKYVYLPPMIFKHHSLGLCALENTKNVYCDSWFTPKCDVPPLPKTPHPFVHSVPYMGRFFGGWKSMEKIISKQKEKSFLSLWPTRIEHTKFHENLRPYAYMG